MTWRVLWFLIKLGVIGALAVFFALEPGRVTFDWQGWVVDMPVGVFALIILVLVLLFIYGERIRQTVFRFPGRWRAQRKAIREMKGYRALTLGMVAVAAGDRDESRRQSRRAKDLLTDAPLTKLLQAQSARLSGDDQAAVAYFEDMRGDPEVAFLGLRGLMTQALRAGDKARALELAEEARRLRPSAKWVLLELLDLQINAGRWAGALKTLDDAERTGALPSPEAAPIRARLSVKQAELLSIKGEDAPALKAAQTALKADPANAEAVTLAASLMRRSGKERKAEKLVEDAWQKAPGPQLAAAYRDLAPEGTSALSQVKRFEKLLSLAPDDAESHMALADICLDAELWGEARSHLAKALDIVGEPVPPRLCRLWARLEQSEHGDLTAAHAWLMRATEAEAAPVPAPVDAPSNLGSHRDDGVAV
ncbi:MAG: heme biosynthesis HemY N-terminal domain-containing protein [Pseudomonadota bacterium]|nr:heme biosynthesis HemY N-terminal domain-containing protein [Pseudomonadota bacterium]